MQRLAYLLGFSLIELMIIVAIMSILTIMAIPSYESYIKRARFAEIISQTEPFKVAVMLALQQGTDQQELTNGKESIPLSPKSTQNINSITVENGIITAIGTSLVDNATYILTPHLDHQTWEISGTCLNLGFCHAA